MVKFIKPIDHAWDSIVQKATKLLKEEHMRNNTEKYQLSMLENCFQNVRLKDIKQLRSEALKQ